MTNVQNTDGSDKTKRKPGFKIGLGWRARRLQKHLTPPKPRTAYYGFCLDTIFPTEVDFVGRRESMRRLLGDRMPTWVAVAFWANGRRRPPVWALQALDQAAVAKIAALEHARALLRAAIEERERPNPNIGRVK